MKKDESWKRDYPEFDKKEIDWTNGVKYRGLVVGCCYDVGITIVDAKDETDHLVCLPHPETKAAENAAGFENMTATQAMEIYDELFKSAVRMIKAGSYVVGSIEKKCGGGSGRNPNSSICAWS